METGAVEELRFRTVTIPEPLGPAPAWLVPGGRKRWAIVVHGMGAPRGLPLLPVLHNAGLSTIVMSYRNDPGAPPSPDGLTHLGADEWHDLDAAAGYAVQHGARRLTLVGYSMGGAMVCDFLRRSQRAGLVADVVLDSPVLEWRRLLSQAADRGAAARAPAAGRTDGRMGGRSGSLGGRSAGARRPFSEAGARPARHGRRRGADRRQPRAREAAAHAGPARRVPGRRARRIMAVRSEAL